MAYIEKTMFEVTVSNSVNNQTQNVAGKFGTSTGSTFQPEDCAAGILCVRNGLIPSEGYEDFNILNGNTYYFNVATAGTSAPHHPGDHTGIYAANTYDVAKVGSGDNIYNLGANTLGLGIPAGERGDFTELIVGEKYTFGLGNFSTAPTTGVTAGYATIANGRLVFSSSAPQAGSGVYLKLERTKNMTEGTTNWGKGYVMEVCRAEQA